jgi:hypothetical protein
VADASPDLGVPGQVVRNDPRTGEAWVLCGDAGVLALLEVQDETGERYAPGARWRSIRARLGMDVEEELFRLVRRIEDAPG